MRKIIKEEENILSDRELMIAAFKTNQKKIDNHIADLKDFFSKYRKEMNDTINLLKVQLKKHEKAIIAAQTNNEEINDTLRNVLLAISQNEYLQAYYPEQGEFPAGKYTGRHPKVQKRIDSKIKK